EGWLPPISGILISLSFHDKDILGVEVVFAKLGKDKYVALSKFLPTSLVLWPEFPSTSFTLLTLSRLVVSSLLVGFLQVGGRVWFRRLFSLLLEDAFTLLKADECLRTLPVSPKNVNGISQSIVLRFWFYALHDFLPYIDTLTKEDQENR
ncbi:20263_t:CDS:2, partial [Gigaspora rosea]